MKSTTVCFALLATLWSGSVRAAEPAATPERMEWFREAKFGMFIHWGIYSVPGQSEKIQLRTKMPASEYDKIAAQLKPVEFDAKEWVRIAKDASVKYLVILLGAAIAHAADAPKPKPNIVYILASDIGEKNNLAASNPEKLAEMKEVFRQLLKDAVPSLPPEKLETDAHE